MSKHTYIIAEAGVNHNGSLEMAKRLIDAAVEARADAVKFQTFKAEGLVSKHASKAEYQKKFTDANESQYEMIKKLELNEEAHHELIQYCFEKNIDFLSTPFDMDSVELLAHKFNLPALKISSGDLTNMPLLYKAATSQKSILLSTGLATLGDIESALGVIAFGYVNEDEQPSLDNFNKAYLSQKGQLALQEKVTLLHCTTDYPTQYEDVHLNKMTTLSHAFGLRAGYSDHTIGISVPIAAVALGAVVIEKHFTMDRSLPGPDQQASLEPDELQQMVKSIREIEKSLGSFVKGPVESELKNKNAARKSIVAARAIRKGELFTEDNIVLKRPGNGLSPNLYWEMLGQISGRDYEIDELLK
ncbi:N-acetylneuraminate synthase [Paenibacillus sepulcri]|uniref:N-acetylneuraminate synthase n=1 Tax=Paenibacillus sepulcri TaxID=359917 RepID=A0ABS7BV32_9BACL|nr:N-acetylneuraminate synthase [Paenibacillus sepulcri]